MRYFLYVIAICTGGLAFAQSEEEVAAARLIYLEGNYADALEVLRPAALAGNANAQNLLGDAYLDGLGVEKDLAKAEEWWKKSAAQGFDKALYNVGWAYDKGRFISGPDAEKARKFYELAIEQDNHFAFNNLAQMYTQGRFAEGQDFELATQLYERAIELGNIEALNNLGQAYVFGQGVREDMETALQLFQRAADAGDATGFNNLGAMYGNGYGVTANAYAAFGLYKVAAELGDAQAAINLAFYMIEDPEFGLYDPSEGWGWCVIALERAAKTALDDAQADCDFLSEQVSDKDKTLGRAFADAMREE